MDPNQYEVMQKMYLSSMLSGLKDMEERAKEFVGVEHHHLQINSLQNSILTLQNSLQSDNFKARAEEIGLEYIKIRSQDSAFSQNPIYRIAENADSDF
jgi:hypothetical protein